MFHIILTYLYTFLSKRQFYRVFALQPELIWYFAYACFVFRSLVSQRFSGSLLSPSHFCLVFVHELHQVLLNKASHCWRRWRSCGWAKERLEAEGKAERGTGVGDGPVKSSSWLIFLLTCKLLNRASKQPKRVTSNEWVPYASTVLIHSLCHSKLHGVVERVARFDLWRNIQRHFAVYVMHSGRRRIVEAKAEAGDEWICYRV